MLSKVVHGGPQDAWRDDTHAALSKDIHNHRLNSELWTLGVNNLLVRSPPHKMMFFLLSL